MMCPVLDPTEGNQIVVLVSLAESIKDGIHIEMEDELSSWFDGHALVLGFLEVLDDRLDGTETKRLEYRQRRDEP